MIFIKQVKKLTIFVILFFIENLNSMKSTLTKNLLLFYIIIILTFSYTFAQPTIQWVKFFGGSGYEYSHLMIDTKDGGFILVGQTGSNDGDVSGGHDIGGALIMYEGWVAKLDSMGELKWQKCLGGKKSDKLYSIAQTKDGGYIVAGEVESNDGDVKGNHGSSIDMWVVKLTSIGEIEWQKCLGGNNIDIAYEVIQTSDGGFLVVGQENSIDGDVTGNHGLGDGWIVKLSESGAIQWQKCIGGTKNDFLHSIIKLNDGGYVFSGYTLSNDGDVNGNHGNVDVLVGKLNVLGETVWIKSFGGSLSDFAQSIVETKDNGYLITGDIESNDNDVVGLHGLTDGWVLKLNKEGKIQWQKCLGGKDEDWTTSIIESKNGGYLLSGYSQSNDGDAITRPKRNGDIWVVKLNPFTDVEDIIFVNMFDISPNPATDFIEITVGEGSKAALTSGIKIYNIFGQTVLSVGAILELPSRVDVSALPPGIYFVRLGDKVTKFVKL